MSWSMLAEIMLYCLLGGGAISAQAGASVWAVIYIGEKLVYRFT